MKLSKFDGKCVRLTDRRGDVFEGVCSHNSADYCMHEFGREEESLQMSQTLFYKSDIKKIKTLKKIIGPYGCFPSPYGKLEEEIALDGADMIEEVLTSEEDESVLRMLRCLAQTPISQADRAALTDLLGELVRSAERAEIRSEASQLLETWTKT